MSWAEAPMDGKVAVAFIGVRLTIAVASNVGNVSFWACSLVVARPLSALAVLCAFIVNDCNGRIARARDGQQYGRPI